MKPAPRTLLRVTIAMAAIVGLSSLAMLWRLGARSTPDRHDPAEQAALSQEGRVLDADRAKEAKPDSELEADREAASNQDADYKPQSEGEGASKSEREKERERELLRAAGSVNGGLEKEEDDPLARDKWFYELRTAGNPNFSVADAAVQRSAAAQTVLGQKAMIEQALGRKPVESRTANGAAISSAKSIASTESAASTTSASAASTTSASTASTAATSPSIIDALASLHGFAGDWQPVGPDPINWGVATSGRVTALAIRPSPPYTVYLGAAQGGIWVSSTLTTGWQPVGDDLPTQAIGDIRIAPSDSDIIYVGTGEGSVSYESYFGDGVYKSTNAGRTWAHVGSDLFNQVSISRLAIDPVDPEHVYAATVRGSNGARRQRAGSPAPYGILETRDGGANWKALITTTDQRKGATDLVIDPLQPNNVYATFWGQGIVKSIDGGRTWHPAMNGLPGNADYSNPDRPNYPSRFAIAIGHTSKAVSATLYTGFDWVDTSGQGHPPTIWKSTDEGANWVETTRQNISNYCASQCWYDNVIVVDPTNSEVAYVLGQWSYGRGSGGVYRTMDGGATWVDIGRGQHPDFHAFAVRRDAPQNVYVGNDGGVWASDTYGGRLNAGEPNTAAQWLNLNGLMDPDTGKAAIRTGLQIAQFVSIGQHPTNPDRFYGGTQDNGTLVREAAGNTWTDVPGGDGGQVIVDPDGKYVYGTQYGISPYRWTNATGEGDDRVDDISGGIDGSDRAAFYIPWNIDPEETQRLYLGTFRIWRTDDRGDHWAAISPDLTARCANRDVSPSFHECVITAVGTTAGGQAVYSGAGDGRIFLTTNAYAEQPNWRRVDKSPLPTRPIQGFAVDRSNYRIAYAAYVGFSAATPTQPGHVFKTVDGGETWTNVSGDLPDVPVNWVVLDATDPATLYAATDVGPMVTVNGGRNWLPLGTGLPLVAAWQLDFNPFTRQIVVGTHGRGAYRLRDAATLRAALRVRAFEPGLPVGPGSLLTYTLTVRNMGNAPAAGVMVRDPLPADTSFVSADNGGAVEAGGGAVAWRGLAVPAGGSVSEHLTVRISGTAGLKPGSIIHNDGLAVTADNLAAISGSPLDVVLAEPLAVKVTPQVQMDGMRPGQTITYTLSIENRGYLSSGYALRTTGNVWATSFWDGTFGAAQDDTPVVLPGDSVAVGVKVQIPVTAARDQIDEAHLTVSPFADASVVATATLRTAAVTDDVLLVDQDGNNPDVQSAYRTALFATGRTYDVWDLAGEPKLPARYVAAHRAVVWFTGTTMGTPLAPYEGMLSAYLDAGGRLFLSGWDVLLTPADFTPFARSYLHLLPLPQANLNPGTTKVSGVETNTLTAGLGELTMNPKVLAPDGDNSDWLSLSSPALAAFTDDSHRADGMSVESGAYRVVFLAFPFEAMGATKDRADVMTRVLRFFGLERQARVYMPVMLRSPTGRPW